jgi:hypothetical protein
MSRPARDPRGGVDGNMNTIIGCQHEQTNTCDHLPEAAA